MGNGQARCPGLPEAAPSAPGPGASTLLSCLPCHVLRGKEALTARTSRGSSPRGPAAFPDAQEEQRTLAEAVRAACPVLCFPLPLSLRALGPALAQLSDEDTGAQLATVSPATSSFPTYLEEAKQQDAFSKKGLTCWCVTEATAGHQPR